MSEEHLRSHLQLGEFNQRLSAAATGLLSKTTKHQPPGSRHIALARRLFLTSALAVLGLVVGVILIASFLASGALPWVVGAVLVLATVGVIVLGAHAGGHGWLVPLPVLALAGAWALTVSAGSWASAAAWVLAVLAFTSAAIAAVLVVPAIAYRRSPVTTVVGTEALVGATGLALSALAPAGRVRVNNETWTAQSLSGPLPAGAPVHVVRVEGVRLLVWSEAGDVPGPEALGSTNKEKEEQ